MSALCESRMCKGRGVAMLVTPTSTRAICKEGVKNIEQLPRFKSGKYQLVPLGKGNRA